MSEEIRPVNTPRTRDKNGRWLSGHSPNPRGRPKDGESWAAIIKACGDMYPEDIIAFIGKDNPLGAQIAQLPKGVQMKYLITARVFASMMFEPSSSLWKELMERAEGKIPDHLNLSGELSWKNFIEKAEKDDNGI